MQDQLIQKLLEIEAVKLQPSEPFTWASGMLSPIYCDNRIALSYPATRDLIQDGFVQIAGSCGQLDGIAGVATAGIAHGAILADRLGLPFLYVRARKKDHGRQNLIEGKAIAGNRVLLVEDLISTGGSCIQAANALEDAGVTVAKVAAIFQYNLPAAQHNFESAGLEFETLTDFNNLVRHADEKGFFPPSEVELLRRWKDDPKAWAVAFSREKTDH